MSGAKFEYLDEDGVSLKVTALPACGPLGDISAVTVQGGPECRVLAEHRAEVAAGLWTGAGLPAPVILERPAHTFEDGVNRAGSIEVGRLGGRVTVGLYGIQPEEIEPAVARRLAALIAIRADEAQHSEPDPAEVEELATLLHASREPGVSSSGRSSHGEWDLRDARAVLRAGYRRDEQQGDTP